MRTSTAMCVAAVVLLVLAQVCIGHRLLGLVGMLLSVSAGIAISEAVERQRDGR